MLRAHFAAMNGLPSQQTDFEETLFLNWTELKNVEIIHQG
jgi:hypothetical protein